MLVLSLLSSLTWFADGNDGGHNNTLNNTNAPIFQNVPAAWRRHAMVSKLHKRGHARLFVPQSRGGDALGDAGNVSPSGAGAPSSPSKIAFLFLARGPMPLEPVWTAFFNAPGVQAADWVVHVSSFSLLYNYINAYLFKACLPFSRAVSRGCSKPFTKAHVRSKTMQRAIADYFRYRLKSYSLFSR